MSAHKLVQDLHRRLSMHHSCCSVNKLWLEKRAITHAEKNKKPEVYVQFTPSPCSGPVRFACVLLNVQLI